MANEDLGVKRDCPNCGSRFYDLKKDPAHCPKCDHEFTPDVLLKSRKRLREEEQSVPKPSAKVGDEADELDEEIDELDEEVEEIDAEAENTTSLDAAESETAPVKSKRAKSLDDDEDDDDDEESDELAGIDDIDLPDEEDDDTLLDDEDDDSDIAAIATPGKNDEDR